MRRQQLAAITTSGSAASSPFILHPTHLEVPAEPIIGAASVHGILGGWRQSLQAVPVPAGKGSSNRLGAQPHEREKHVQRTPLDRRPGAVHGLSGLLHAALGRSRLELAAALLATPLTVVFFDWSGRKLSARRLTRQDVLLFAVIGADDAGTDFVRSGRCALRDTRRRWHFFARATKSRGAACDHERCSVGPA